jgi:lipoprotein NlpD
MVPCPGRMAHALPRLACAALVATLLGCSTPPAVSVESRPDRTPIKATVYIVRSGDTLWSIAWRAGFDHRQVAAWNGLRPPYTIYPGQRLRLTSPYRTAPKALSKRQIASSKPAPSHTSGSRTALPRSARGSSKPNASLRKQPSTQAPSGSTRLSWHWPTRGVVVQGFSSGDATRKGMKIRGELGQPILAAEAGRVVYSGSGLIGYGRLIIIKHNKNYLSAYGYNRRILVEENDQVARGQQIAEMGRNGGGPPMLHFEIRRRGRPVDPAQLLPTR